MHVIQMEREGVLADHQAKWNESEQMLDDEIDESDVIQEAAEYDEDLSMCRRFTHMASLAFESPKWESLHALTLELATHV